MLEEDHLMSEYALQLGSGTSSSFLHVLQVNGDLQVD